MFSKLKLNASVNRLLEERLFALVAQEMSENNIREGLWAKAFSQSDGDENKAKSKYIGLRVEALKDEKTVIDALLKELKDSEVEKNKPVEIDTNSPIYTQPQKPQKPQKPIVTMSNERNKLDLKGRPVKSSKLRNLVFFTVLIIIIAMW